MKDIDDNIFRIFSNNVNGLTTASSGNELSEELSVMKEYDVSVATLTETNFNWKLPGVYSD
eukprot:10765891-Ditylum_brightwellii.AAC.1